MMSPHTPRHALTFVAVPWPSGPGRLKIVTISENPAHGGAQQLHHGDCSGSHAFGVASCLAFGRPLLGQGLAEQVRLEVAAPKPLAVIARSDGCLPASMSLSFLEAEKVTHVFDLGVDTPPEVGIETR